MQNLDYHDRLDLTDLHADVLPYARGVNQGSIYLIYVKVVCVYQLI